MGCVTALNIAARVHPMEGRHEHRVKPPPPPLYKSMRMFLFFSVFLFFVCSYLEDPLCSVPALSVYRNVAQANVVGPSFWFDHIVAARDEDEAIADDCYEASVRLKNKIPGMPAGAGRCRNWDPGTLRPAACSYYFGLTNKSTHACSYFDRVFLCGGGGLGYTGMDLGFKGVCAQYTGTNAHHL